MPRNLYSQISKRYNKARKNSDAIDQISFANKTLEVKTQYINPPERNFTEHLGSQTQHSPHFKRKNVQSARSEVYRSSKSKD